MTEINYQRLSYLGDKVKAELATKNEKDEFMSLLYQNGSITESQHKDYIAGRNVDKIVNAGLAVGAIVLLGYLFKSLFSENK